MIGPGTAPSATRRTVRSRDAAPSNREDPATSRAGGPVMARYERAVVTIAKRGGTAGGLPPVPGRLPGAGGLLILEEGVGVACWTWRSFARTRI